MFSYDVNRNYLEVRAPLKLFAGQGKIEKKTGDLHVLLKALNGNKYLTFV